jgi:tetrahydromethanopterin S-methyltransferase subunit B
MKVDSVDASANPVCEQLKGSECIVNELVKTLTTTVVSKIIQGRERLLSTMGRFGKAISSVEEAIVSKCLF